MSMEDSATSRVSVVKEPQQDGEGDRMDRRNKRSCQDRGTEGRVIILTIRQEQARGEVSTGQRFELRTADRTVCEDSYEVRQKHLSLHGVSTTGTKIRGNMIGGEIPEEGNALTFVILKKMHRLRLSLGITEHKHGVSVNISRSVSENRQLRGCQHTHPDRRGSYTTRIRKVRYGYTICPSVEDISVSAVARKGAFVPKIRFGKQTSMEHPRDVQNVMTEEDIEQVGTGTV